MSTQALRNVYRTHDIVVAKDPTFGAKGDGLTDDSAAIQAAHDALGVGGGEVFLGLGDFLHNSTLVFSKPITLRGVTRTNDNTARLRKGATLAGAGIRVTGVDVTLDNLAYAGTTGNTGDGISVEGGRFVGRNLSVTGMGQDGIRIGTDAVGNNCNLWTLENCIIYGNTRRGLYLHSGDANANAGCAVRCFFWANGEDGVQIGNAHLNTFTACTSEANTGWGLRFIAAAHDNMWVNGDIEANTAGQISRATGATRNIVLLPNKSWATGARVYNSVAISIPNATPTKLTFDSERFDTDDCHENVTNPGRLTCNNPGKYLITANVGFADNAVGWRQVAIKWNDSTYIGMDAKLPISGSITFFSVSTTYDMADGDYVEVVVYQSSGGALNAEQYNQATPEFSMVRLL